MPGGHILDRFYSYIYRHPLGCHLWIGATNQYGYGVFNLHSGQFVLAHRFAFELERGPIESEMTIDHLCRTRRCTNPAHLEVVTRGENSRRGNRARAH